MVKIPLDLQTFFRLSMVKRTRYITYTLLLLFFVTNIIAQDITIDLSIKWSNHVDAKGKTIQTPFLDITYINNSIDNKYYLLKQSRPTIVGNPFPEFDNDDFALLQFRTIEENMNYIYRTRRDYTDTSFVGQKYYILIENNALIYGTDWYAQKDTTLIESDNNEEERDGSYYDLIEYALVSAYDSMYTSNYGHTKGIRTEFAKTEFTDSTISNSAIDCFVFLKPLEKHVDTYNLHGLQLVGGNFEILFKKNIITDKVYNGYFWDSNSQKKIKSYIKLPKKVNGYQLYSGKFKTNHAFLEITE